MSTNWLVDLVPATRPKRVAYLFPHAGAGVSAVLALGRALAPDPHPVAIRLPGRETLLDEPPITDLPTLAKKLAHAIRTHAGGAQTILYGHSSGSILAYETARTLQPHTPAALLATSAQQAPGTPVHTTAGCWNHPDNEFFAQVIADGYLPPELLNTPDILQIIAPALRADYQATHQHLTTTTHWTPLTTPILTIHATQDPTVTPQDLTAWSTLTTHHHTTTHITAGHNLLRDHPTQLANTLHHALP
ncbi:thioesterase II family protein [Streptomyces tubercidicus]|uniref:thioesterase II family protein n=1 Tax=Streptomyces tubercidicus TaxID=47759 RepID=UPI0036A4C311